MDVVGDIQKQPVLKKLILHLQGKLALGYEEFCLRNVHAFQSFLMPLDAKLQLSQGVHTSQRLLPPAFA